MKVKVFVLLMFMFVSVQNKWEIATKVEHFAYNIISKIYSEHHDKEESINRSKM